MRLAIADPPYLGSAETWYGTKTAAPGGGLRKADSHPDAQLWDDPDAHRDLISQLDGRYDGWAVAMTSTVASLRVYTDAAPDDAQVLAWCRPNAMPGPNRLIRSWEPVLVRVPPGRVSRTAPGVRRTSHLVLPFRAQGFAGAKPPEWTRWLLDVLGYDPGQDTVTDVFAGSGAVDAWVRQGVLL